MPRRPKQIRLALGYDSFTVEGETDKTLVLAFDSPLLARAAFEEKLTKARKRDRLDVIDATRRLDDLQCEWRGDQVTRAWFPTAAALADTLARPELAAVEEIGIGRPDGPSFDSALDVLAARRPPITALAFGDLDVVEIPSPARIAELYPALARLRLTAATIAAAALDRPWPALIALTLHARRSPGDWGWLWSGAHTPALAHLGIAGALVEPLARSALVEQLRSVALYDADERAAAKLRGLVARVTTPAPSPASRTATPRPSDRARRS